MENTNEELFSSEELEVTLTQEELEAQLAAEMEARIAEENRIRDIKARFNGLVDVRLVMDEVRPNTSNTALVLRDMLQNPNPTHVEAELAAMEIVSEVIKAERAEEAAGKVMKDIKAKRNEMLRDSDFSQLADAPLSPEQRTEMREYRTYLRELPVLIERAQANEEVLTLEEWRENKPLF